MKFGEKVQTLRRAKGLSRGLAEALGVTRQAVSKWELNASLPDVEKVLVLSDLFRSPPTTCSKKAWSHPRHPRRISCRPRRRRLDVKLLVGAILTVLRLLRFLWFGCSHVCTPQPLSISNPDGRLHPSLDRLCGICPCVTTCPP